ncbi:toll-like receptor 2 isoform X1 [Drosophila pseudoobscura]|uniref:Toll-like receptor 2 isoform X1 n=2 Tax=Drosophila pseudoobscura TaxID=7237 RepID=A0A6I8W9S4_DROPS|nr:toll-like receptor 2 isoform X1 [Drosophila pseudoobscura]
MPSIFILEVFLVLSLLRENAQVIHAIELSNSEGQQIRSEESGESTADADLKSALLKYDSDDGNSCLLDIIKEDVLWWTFPNGTLKRLNGKYSPYLYLDLSHGNMKEDIDLFQQTKLSTIPFNTRKVEVFSAAFNTLNAVPYQALYSLKDSLKLLSLRGNKFADLLPDAEAFERFLNETRLDSNYTTQHKCEQFLASNATDLYDRECFLYIHNNTNTSNANMAPKNDKTYGDYIQFLREKVDLLDKSQQSIAWATFPNLTRLVELDISNCSIEYVEKEVFKNLTNLKRLFMSDNKIMTIQQDTFYYIQRVQYLDISFTNVLTYSYQISMPTLEMAMSLIYGLKIQQNAFKLLPELVYLDVSHSKMTRNSAVAFAHLGPKLKFLSLCYTAIPMVSSAIFKNTALEGLDLSGNPFVSNNILDDAFDGIARTLKYLYFEHSNLKDMEWARPLKNVQILGLAGNNINALSSTMFESLKSLEILDLSSNHVGNWYKSAFDNNFELRVLNLRSNNINVLTNEMLKDFEHLEYLSLGDNNFICNCHLREVVEVAAGNNKEADCSYNLLNINTANSLNIQKLLGTAETLNIDRKLWQSRFLPQLTKSYNNIKDYKRVNKIFKLRFIAEGYNASRCPASTPYQMSELSSELVTLKFQLLDYDATQYWCFNDTDQLQVEELNCQVRTMTEIATKLHNLTTTVIAVVASILGLSICGFIIYLKRWHIHYYYSSLKSAALLSSASKESVDSLTHLSQRDPSAVYDIFISYCQNDRTWVLNELLPNVEEAGDISICLHERDFQIGVTILDNIISCMDRSHSLMLIISSKFLLSHWCQFEMYLAQHRIFEVSKEHLILVFLEDIPRSKRPKTLQYLMDVKTYIKWPVGKGDEKPKLEERKLFWKRLRRSLEVIGISSSKERA